MEKLKEIFHKLKNTEINLKDIKLSSIKDKFTKLKNTEINLKDVKLSNIKEKFANLKNTQKENNDNVKYELSLQNLKNLKKLKNISLNDIKSFDYKAFYNRNKQQILTIFVAFMAVFFLFYWTSVFLNSKLTASETQAENTYKRLENVANMAGQIQFAKSKGVNAMTLSLLVFIQNTGTEIGISDKIVNLRPVAASKDIEHVALRVENLYYDEFINLIKEIEKYNNLSIRVVNFNKRYDNPKMIDASIEVVKM